ncbi:ECF RNA polymerase sigma factor SigK [Streptomyces sp. NPDC003016]
MREIARTGRTAQRGPEPADVVARVTGGDQDAFAALYDEISGPVHGLVLKALRDPPQSDEVARDIMVEVWRTATRFRPDRGSVMPWVMTMAHRRAVDRVRSEQAATAREQRDVLRERMPEYDQAGAEVAVRLESEDVRRCLRTLTGPQCQAVTLAYHQGCAHREGAVRATAPLGTVRTRLRDGLIRFRDCRGVNP